MQFAGRLAVIAAENASFNLQFCKKGLVMSLGKHGFLAIASAFALMSCGSSADNDSGLPRLDAFSAQAVAGELIKPRLKDPSSAEFSNITFKQSTAERSMIICGYVNSKNAFGGMTGPQRFVTGGTVAIEDEIGAANMDTLWNLYC